MTVHDDLVYVRHIAGALDKIASYARGLTQAEFVVSSMIQDAVVRQFEVIGEATKNISPGFRNLHGELPWPLMAQMRDRLIHHYWDVDVSILWTTVTEDLPKITLLVLQLLP